MLLTPTRRQFAKALGVGAKSEVTPIDTARARGPPRGGAKRLPHDSGTQLTSSCSAAAPTDTAPGKKAPPNQPTITLEVDDT